MASIRKFGIDGAAASGVGLPLMLKDGALKIVDGGGITSALVTTTTGSVTTEVHVRTRTAGTVATAFKFNAASAQGIAAQDFVVNPGGNATTATTGFLFIPSCAGTPTGVPANTYTNCVPIQYNRTAHKLAVYDVSWLQSVALT